VAANNIVAFTRIPWNVPPTLSWWEYTQGALVLAGRLLGLLWVVNLNTFRNNSPGIFRAL